MTLLALSACADGSVLEEEGRIDLSALATGTLHGLAPNPWGSTMFVLVEGVGIVEFEEDGTPVRTFHVGEDNLLDLPYRDIAALGEHSFLLIADNEGYLWDQRTGDHRVHFCVEPGFAACFDANGELVDADGNGICDLDEQPVEPGAPVTVQRNDALALVGSAVVAAPRFYESGARVEASLRTYRATDGAPLGAVDITSLQVDVAGLASDGWALVAVAGDRALRLRLDGSLESELHLAGVGQAAGVMVDHGRLRVLDAEQQAVVSFPWSATDEGTSR